MIGSIVFYTMLYRGGMPGWIEILKKNLPGKKRGVIFSLGSALGYVEGVVLAIGVGYLLDNEVGSWRWMFPVSALLGLVGVLMQSRIPIEVKYAPLVVEKVSFGEYLSKPWKESWKLVRSRPDFSCYEWSLMFCGIGVMIIQPALPLFFVDVLGLSYTDLAIALSICKGMGFASTSPVWGQWLSKVNFFNISGSVFVFMGAFPLLLLFAPFNVIWVYIAYFIYGIAQAGSHLTWNLSGTIFAKEEDSSLFSTVNVMTVGLRGAVIPPLGGLLCFWLGPLAVLGAGAVACFYGSFKIMSSTHLIEPQEAAIE
jgi:MFS family permease